jgi:hypothetical protein
VLCVQDASEVSGGTARAGPRSSLPACASLVRSPRWGGPREEHQRRWTGFGATALIQFAVVRGRLREGDRRAFTRPMSSSTSLPANAIPGAQPAIHDGSADISLYSVHLDELEWQVEVAVIILNPTFLVFIQLVAT